MIPAFIPSLAAARRSVSRTAVNIIILATPVLADRSVVLVLVHHTAHLPMHLTHAIHIHAVIAATLPGGPISIDAGVLSALAVAIPCLF